jgi:hypothetical protein
VTGYSVVNPKKGEDSSKGRVADYSTITAFLLPIVRCCGGLAMANSGVHCSFGMGNLSVLNTQCEGLRAQVEALGLVEST